MKGLLKTQGRRRGPRRPAIPTYRSSARRAADRWLRLAELGVGDPKAVA